MYNCTIEIPSPPAVGSLRYPDSASSHGLKSPGGVDDVIVHQHLLSSSHKHNEYQSL